MSSDVPKTPIEALNQDMNDDIRNAVTGVFADGVDREIETAINEVGRMIAEEARPHENICRGKSKRVDPNLIRYMVTVGATAQEIAARSNISITTLYRRFGKVIMAAQITRNLALRRAQFKSAVIDGDPGMQKWLGVNLMGQKWNVEVTGLGGGPLEVHHEHDFKSLTRAELYQRAAESEQRLGRIHSEIKALLAAPAAASEVAGVGGSGSGNVGGDQAADRDPGRALQSAELHPGQ